MKCRRLSLDDACAHTDLNFAEFPDVRHGPTLYSLRHITVTHATATFLSSYPSAAILTIDREAFVPEWRKCSTKNRCILS